MNDHIQYHTTIRTKLLVLLAWVSALFGIPSLGMACACGCNVFTVGTPWSMPIRSGFEVFFQYNFMDQRTNWNSWSSAPASMNEDVEIRTSFYTLGLQYMPSREWGITIDAPAWDRYFHTTLDDGSLASVTHSSFGDVRVMGMYTGLSDDMSTGLQFGVKLPTGSFDQSLMDRDTQIGTGTTDLLLGGYRMGQETGWGWYAQVMWQHAFNTRDGYRPGDSFDVNGGVHFDRVLSSIGIIPMVQVAASFRGIDGGDEAEPDNTGYDRVYIAPGIEAMLLNGVSIYASVRIPVLTHVRGNQLVASQLVDITLSYGI